MVIRQSVTRTRGYLAVLVLSVLLSSAIVMPVPRAVEAQQDRSRQLTQEEPKQQSGRRMALIIGNGAYTNAPRLKNPANDATDIAEALSKLGFNVDHGVDLTQKQMKFMIREFGQKLRGGGQGLFYFSGHGVQLRGRNYLIPVDADIQSETDVEDQGVDANLVLGLMDEAGNGLNVVILDACRNNPFARSFRSASNGLAQVDAPTGTLIAYATAPGRVARDGAGRNGTYTAELLNQMRVLGLPIEELLKHVRANVKQQTNGDQVPWESSSLIGDFYLNKAVGASSAANKTTGAPIVNPAAVEQEYWETIKNSTDTEDFRDYLKEYPAGPHAVIARSNLRRFETASKTSTSGASNAGGTSDALNNAGVAEPSALSLKSSKVAFLDGDSIQDKNLVSREIGAFAAKYGITTVFDISKLNPAILTISPSMDITKDFVSRSINTSVPESKIAFVDTGAFGDQREGILKYIEAVKSGKDVDKVSKDVGRSLDAFANQHGITMILDISKLAPAILTVNPSMDITKAFITNYNEKSLGTTATAQPVVINVPVSKIAFIDTEAFGDQNRGITIYVNALKQLEDEFKPLQDELNKLRGSELEKKKKDADAAFKKRWEEVVLPITKEVAKNIDLFATKYGITVILDVSKLSPAIKFSDDQINLTKDFIYQFNKK